MLENQIDAYEENFISQHPNLTNDQLDVITVSSGFKSQQPLIDFENQYFFNNSLRVNYNTLVDQWLNHEELDLATDPDNDILFDAVEQALLNDQQEVMIGESIYVFGKPEKTYQITGDYGSSLSAINSGQDVSNNPYIIVTNRETGACKSWISTNDLHGYAAQRRVKRVLTIRSFPFFCKTLATVCSYKKDGNSWKRSYNDLGVSLQVYLKDDNCNATRKQGFKSESIRRRRERTVRQFNLGESYTLRSKNGASLSGTFKYAGLTTTKVQSW